MHCGIFLSILHTQPTVKRWRWLLGEDHLISGRGNGSFLKKKKLHLQSRLKKKNHYPKESKKEKKERKKETSLPKAAKKKNQPDPEIQWRNGYFWRQKLHPPVRLQKTKQNKQTKNKNKNKTKKQTKSSIWGVKKEEKEINRPQLPCPPGNQMVRPLSNEMTF